MFDYLYSSYAYVVPPVLGVVVLLSLCLIALFRGRNNTANLLFAGLCFLGAVINADVAAVSLISDKQLALKVDRFTYFFTVFSVPLLIQFVHAFLGIGKRLWLEYLAYFLSLFFLFFTPSSLFISGLQTFSFGTIARAGPVFHVFSLIAGLAVCYCAFTLWDALRRAGENELRNRIKYMLIGTGLITLLIAMNALPVLGVAIYPPGNFSFIPATFLAFGVLKYDLLDIGAVIRRGTVYFMLTAVLTLLYVAIIYALNKLIISPGKGTVIIPLVLSLFMVLLFDPIKEGVRSFIDGLFFRRKYDYRRFLKETSGMMVLLLKTDQITELLLKSLYGALQVSRVGLFLREAPDTGTFTYFEKGAGSRSGEEGFALADTHPLAVSLQTSGAPLSRIAAERKAQDNDDDAQIIHILDRIKATLVIPMFSRDRLLGMVVLGDKRSGELLVHEDIEMVATIANQAVTAIENARSYEELERLNLELEKKVEQRTASLNAALAEKERTQEQLIEAESIAAVGQLVAGVAHELNNPLASASSLIQTSIETLSTHNAENDAQTIDLVDDLKFSLRELKRMAEIIKSMLGLSRKTQVYVEPVMVNAALDDALRVLYNQYKNLRLEVEKIYDPDLPVIEGNFANLGQVFINVVKNAFQSLSKGGGRISLKTAYVEERESVTIECTDTGKGIPAHQLKDIFKPFFTTKGPGEGTGLGLYISYEIVKRHGGSIVVKSERGRGTSVLIELPCYRRET